MAVYTYSDIEAHHMFHSGGGIHGTLVADTFNLTATNSLAQFHPFGGPGNDNINMIFKDIDGFAHGHHTFADFASNPTYADTYNFVDIDEVHSGGVIVGRLDDYDSTRDTIKIEGKVLDLYDISSFEHPKVSSIRIVEYNGAHNDEGAHSQQWLLINTSTGGKIFYAIEGARVDMNGDGGSQNDERHFLMPDELPASFRELKSVKFVAKHNYVPAGYTAEVGGVVYNDRDVTIADVNDVIGDDDHEASPVGDLIAGGLNADFITALEGNDYIWGGSGHDRLFGDGGDDYIEGNSGSDLLVGGQGADHLLGGIGDDELTGGEGDDVLVGGRGSDKLFGDSGTDTADYKMSGLSIRVDLSDINEQGYVLGFGGHAKGDWLYGIENITGSAGHGDLITGSDGENVLRGLGGNDQLFGRGGDDVLVGGQGQDQISGNLGNDYLYGGTGKDKLIGGCGSDILIGGYGADKLMGGLGSDTADYSGSMSGVRINLSKHSDGSWCVGRGGQAAGDKLKGVENIIGSAASNDFIKGSAADNSLVGLGGNDRLLGFKGDDLLVGGDGDDTLRGGDGNDILTGGEGNDTLIGGRGAGSDVLNGGLGDDVFIFHRNFGNDVISDFDALGSSDVVDLSRVADIANFEDLMINHVNQVGADVLIHDDSGNSIVLENVNSADLAADDFIF